ncbi:hypothetical protein BCV70DRAFT_158291 [Testicularia cyperi]|uniref:RING-CH-type domain-containing protein n=1 Tax=Testicularia cyperi TaxID=1882483 RepID=A0A317XVZ2_9BASI|nr:hypothetical protein BCV70DRAFT_158291 [Testicularia cyperi]
MNVNTDASTESFTDAGASSSRIASQRNLENDLLPSPTAPGSESSVSSGYHSRSPSNAYANIDGSSRVYRFPAGVPPPFGSGAVDERVVTVRDLRNKSCWICSEEDEDSHPSSSASSFSGSATTEQRRRRRFVHPCNCTLVAHESCLLQWIEQSRVNHPLQDTVSCPQCKAPYILVENKPVLLRWLESADRVVTRLLPIGSAVAVGGTFLIASTAYGCVAIRLAMGKDAAKRALASPWPWHYWVDIPLIPFALIAAKLRFFDSPVSWIPTIFALPMANLPLTSRSGLLDRYVEASLLTGRAYPPGPTMTLLLMPWMRVFYLALKRKVYRMVLSPFFRRNSRSNDANADGGSNTNRAAEQNSGARRRRRRRVIVVGESNAHLVDADPPPGTEGVVNGLPGDDANGQAGQDLEDPPQTIYVSPQSLGRLCLGALSLPVIANLMGRLLGSLARHSQYLARFLGMEPFLTLSRSRSFSSSSSILSRAGPKSSASASTSSAPAPSPSPIAGLFRGSLPGFDDVEQHDSGSGLRFARSRRMSFRDQINIFGQVSYDDLDPVWWRNAVGAGIFIVVKDAASLLFKYLKLQQKNTTRILDLPFQASLVAGLDLRDDA